jgi:RND superfamily putative drug exporter
VNETRNLAARAGRWSAQHRKTAIWGWLAFVVISLALGSAVGTKKIEEAENFSGDSKAAEVIRSDSGFTDRATERVLIQSRGEQTIQDPEFRAAIADVEDGIQGSPYAVALQSPLDKGHGGQISGDNRSALVIFQLLGDRDQVGDRVDATLAATAAVQKAHPELRIEQIGDASAYEAVMAAIEDDFARAETLSLPITLGILLLAFGALVAAGLPVLLGLSAVMATFGLVALVSQIVPMGDSVAQVILLVGLAVGVDYSLFYIRREREERRLGKSKEAALAAASATSGRAVLVSGFTVMIAMAGMYLTGDATFKSFGTGTIMVVAVAMLGSITVLPALLAWLGDRVDRGRVPLIHRLRRGGREGGAWGWAVDRVLARPVVSVVLAGGLLAALCIPAFGLKTVSSGVQGLPPDLPATKTMNRIEAAFPGGPLPAVVVVKGENVTSPATATAIDQLKFSALATGYMQEPIDVRFSDDRTVAEVSIPLAGNGTDAASVRALEMLREDVVPTTLGKAGLEAHVTGVTAQSEDFNSLQSSRTPWVFAFVLGFAFLLLMVTFRSIVIPLKAIVLNLLSVGAAYGLLVLIFQDGRLESLIGFESIGGITAWLPLFLFVILFGLSMDYHVLILSRVREAYDRGMSTEDAVRHGIKATAGVVTSAAIVMVGVFGVFATLSGLDFKMMGIGLASAVLIDATIVRAVLLPASMKLLGDWNWYLPSWLDWLPHVTHEAAEAPEPVGSRLTVAIERNDGLAKIAIAGDLDLSSVDGFAAGLAEIEAEHPDVLEIDLRGLTFMDSTGLAQLFAANRRAREQGRRVVILKGPGPIDRVLDIAKVEDAIDVVTEPN